MLYIVKIDGQAVGKPMNPPNAFLWVTVLQKSFPKSRVERQRIK
jgi:hypothetical protein